MGIRNNGKSETSNGASPAADDKFSLISNAKLIALYKNLLRCRRSRNAQHVSLAEWGHEAAIVGTIIDLGPGDAICSLDLEQLAAVSDGDALKTLLSGSTRHGKNGLPDPKNSARMNGHARTPFAHAVIGTALARKTANEGKIAVVYCNGKTPDSLRETIHIATIHALPIIFVQELGRATGRQAKNTNATKPSKEQAGKTPWYPSITVDSDDLVAVYRVAYEAISRARMGRGPTLIECQTLRPSAGSTNGRGRHTGDAARNMEHYLRAKGLFDPQLKSNPMPETRIR